MPSLNGAVALPPSASLLEVTETDIRANLALSGPVEALYPELRDTRAAVVAVEE